MPIDDDLILTEPVRKLYYAALEVVDDFDTYGEVFQANDCGEYGENTAIGKLKRALEMMEERG